MNAKAGVDTIGARCVTARTHTRPRHGLGTRASRRADGISMPSASSVDPLQLSHVTHEFITRMMMRSARCSTGVLGVRVTPNTRLPQDSVLFCKVLQLYV